MSIIIVLFHFPGFYIHPVNPVQPHGLQCHNSTCMGTKL